MLEDAIFIKLNRLLRSIAGANAVKGVSSQYFAPLAKELIW